MNNVQKSFKQKAKHGLRAFASGGLLDSFNTRQQGWDAIANNGGGIGVLQNSAVDDWNAGFDARRAAEAEAPQVRRTIMPAAQPIVPDAAPQSLRGFAGGGTVDPVEQMLANMKNKYGVGNQSQPAPAPQPVQQAPAPAPQPARPVQPAPTVQGAIQSIRNRQEMLRNFANGGEIEPFVDGAGFIHGTPGVDKVPAQVAQTGENILVGDGERIVNQKQNEALEALAQKTTGRPLDDYLEGATGQPVGPKLKKGIRAAEFGADVDDLTSRRTVPEVARPAPVAGYNSSPEAAALRERLAAPEGGNAFRNQLAEVRNTGPHPAPATAPARPAAIAPEMLAPEPAAPARTGLRGMADKVTSAIGKGVDAARNVVAPAAETRPGMGTPGEGALKGYAPKPSGYSGTGIGGVKEAAKDLGRYVVPAAKMAGRGLALASAAHQGWDTGGDLRELWSNDEADLPTKIAGSLEGAGNVAGNILTLGMVHNPVTSLVGAFTGNDTALTRGLRTTGRALDKDVLDKGVKSAPAPAAAAAPAAAPAAAALNPEDNPNIRSLRAAGAQGPVGGDDPRLTAREDMSKGPQMRGIRTIDTANGKVYAGRDGNGRLNITSGLDQTAAESEAARAKEATRMKADMARQVETFDKLALERDMKSNNPADRASAAQRMGLRQLDAQIAQANQQNETTRRGQDLVLQGHQLDNQTKLATLTNQRRTARAENILKQLDNEFGPAMLKDDVPNARRQKFESSLRDTLGEVGLDIGDMPPKDMQEFKKAFEMAERMEPSAARQFYMNWIQGRPFVRDFNPHRQVSRAKGDAGKTDATGLYQTANGWDAYAPSAVDSSFLTGAQDINARRYLDK